MRQSEPEPSQASREHIIAGIVPVPQSEVAMLLESGYLLMELGRWKEAAEVFGGVAALLPHSEVPRVALGNLYFSQGHYAQALKCQDDALKVVPSSALARAHRGECLLFLKRYDEAERDLAAVVDDPEAGDTAQFASALLDAHAAGCFTRPGVAQK